MKNKLLPLMLFLLIVPSCGKSESTKAVLTFDFSGGVINQQTSIELQVNKGIKWSEITNKPIPTKTGYLFNNYFHDDVEIPDDYVIKSDLTVQANYIRKTSTKNFTTDDWGTLAHEANYGLRHLVDLYKPNDSTFVITRNDVTKEQINAKLRTVHVGNHDYKVRVVGEYSDRIKSKNNNISSVLTFEFVDVIDTMPFMRQYIDDPLTGDYSDSYVHKYLTHDFLTKISPDFLNIVENTAVSFGYSEQKDDVYAKFFIPSISQIQLVNDSFEGYVDWTGCYPYYVFNQRKSTRIKHYVDFDGVDHGPVSYMLRSSCNAPFVALDAICHEGSLSQFRSFFSYLGVSPLFAIGHTTNNIYGKRVYCVGNSYNFNGEKILDDKRKITKIDIVIEPKTYKISGQDVALHKLPKLEDLSYVVDGHLVEDIPAEYYDEGEGRITVDPNDVYISDDTSIKMCRSFILIAKGEIALPWNQLINLAHEEESSSTPFLSRYFDIGDYISMYKDGTQDKIARIVDFNHDSFIKNEKVVKAAITFDTKDPFFQGQPWNNNGDNSNYLASDLHKKLTITTMGVESFINIIVRNNLDLFNALKPVEKIITYYDDDSGKWLSKKAPLKVFAPSATEIYGKGAYLNHEFDNDYPSEGERYALYDMNLEDHYRKQYPGETYLKLHLRTPLPSTPVVLACDFSSGEQEWIHVPRLSYINPDNVSSEIAVTPFFAI